MLERLPLEILVSLAYYLDLKSLFAVAAVGSTVRSSLLLDNRLWRDFYFDRWPLLDTSWQFCRLTWWLNLPTSPAPFTNWQEKLLDRLLVERAWRKGPQMAERTVINLFSLTNIFTGGGGGLESKTSSSLPTIPLNSYRYGFRGSSKKRPPSAATTTTTTTTIKKRPPVRIRTVHIVEQDQVYLCRNDGSIFNFNLITGEGELLSQPEKNYDVALGDVLPSRDGYPCDSSVFCDTERLAVIQNSGNGYRWMRIFGGRGVEWRLFTSTVKPRIFGSVLYALQWQRGRWPPMLSRWQLPSSSESLLDSELLEEVPDSTTSEGDYEEVLLDQVVSLSTIEQADNFFLVPLNSLIVISQIEGRWFTWSEFDISVEPPLLRRSRREYVDFFVRSRFSANSRHVIAIGDFPVELRFYPRNTTGIFDQRHGEEGGGGEGEEVVEGSWKLLLDGILSDLLYLADLEIYIVLCAAMIDRNFLLQAFQADGSNREPLWQITTSIQHQVGSHRLHRAGGYIRRVSKEIILVWGTDCLQAFDLTKQGETLWKLKIFDGVMDTNGRRLACRTAQGKISVFDFGLYSPPTYSSPRDTTNDKPAESEITATLYKRNNYSFSKWCKDSHNGLIRTKSIGVGSGGGGGGGGSGGVGVGGGGGLKKRGGWKRLELMRRLFSQFSS